MNILQGWRTIIVAFLALVWAILDGIGINVPLADQEAVATGVVAVIMIAMRIITTTPVPFVAKLFKGRLN